MKFDRWLLTATLALLPAPLFAETPPSPPELEAERAALFTQADADNSGSLSPEEFKTFKSLVHAKMADRHFNRIDRNGDNAISLEELQAERPGRGPGHHPAPWAR